MWALLPAAPLEPTADLTLASAAGTPPTDLGPAPGPAMALVKPAAQQVRPSRPDDEPIQTDMESALARVAGSLNACASEAGRRITVELGVEAGAARFTSIKVLPVEASVDRCIRDVLEPLRFLSQPSATTFITKYRP